MLFITVEAPQAIVSQLENSRVGEFFFTFRGRYLCDILIALFMFAMRWGGIIMGVVLLILVFGVRFVGVRHPEAFGELFRQPAGAPIADDYTLDTYGEGDTVESTLDSSRR